MRWGPFWSRHAQPASLGIREEIPDGRPEDSAGVEHRPRLSREGRERARREPLSLGRRRPAHASAAPRIGPLGRGRHRAWGRALHRLDGDGGGGTRRKSRHPEATRTRSFPRRLRRLVSRREVRVHRRVPRDDPATQGSHRDPLVHVMWLEDRFPWASRTGTGAIEALLACGVRWDERDAERLSGIRRSLLKSSDDDIRRVLLRLQRSEICAPETYQALVRTPRIQERLVALGLVKKLVSERDWRRDEVARLMHRYDRKVLYNQVWSQPVQEVAKSYGISGVRLGKVCRTL